MPEEAATPFSADDELETLATEEALAIVAEPTRAAIVAELGAAWDADAARHERLTFSALRERVDAEDSGRFNYHLDKLVGTFVTKYDDGYALRQPGHRFHQAVVSGTLTERDPVDPVPIADCPECDGTLRASYRSDHVVTVTCDGCGAGVEGLPLPPRGVENRSMEGVLDAARRKTYHEIATLRRGVCHGCGGTVARDLTADVGAVWAGCCDRGAWATLVCEGCNESIVGHPVSVALTAPAVVAFFHDHGRDAARVPPWDDAMDEAADSMTIVDEDPLTVAARFELGGERLRIVLDDDLQVADSERVEI